MFKAPIPRPSGADPTPSRHEIVRALEAKLGTCEFYSYLSSVTPGDREQGYYWNYGYKYCQRFRSSSLASDPKASRWIDCVTINLQRAIIRDCVALGSNHAAIKKAAYAAHAPVYTNCGICELDKSFIKQFRVLFTPDATDLWSKLGFAQMTQALGHCFVRPYLFDGIISGYTSWGDLKEDKLGRALAAKAVANPAANYKIILGIMEMLSNTLNDDDVALEFTKALSNDDLDTLAKTSDGRRILFMMKSAMESGYTAKGEQSQIDRIGDKSQR